MIKFGRVLNSCQSSRLAIWRENLIIILQSCLHDSKLLSSGHLHPEKTGEKKILLNTNSPGMHVRRLIIKKLQVPQGPLWTPSECCKNWASGHFPAAGRTTQAAAVRQGSLPLLQSVSSRSQWRHLARRLTPEFSRWGFSRISSLCGWQWAESSARVRMPESRYRSPSRRRQALFHRIWWTGVDEESPLSPRFSPSPPLSCRSSSGQARSSSRPVSSRRLAWHWMPFSTSTGRLLMHVSTKHQDGLWRRHKLKLSSISAQSSFQ